VCLLQFFDDVTRLEECLRELTSSVETIDEQQHVGLDVSEQLIRQIQVSQLINTAPVNLGEITYSSQVDICEERKKTFAVFLGKFV